MTCHSKTTKRTDWLPQLGTRVNIINVRQSAQQALLSMKQMEAELVKQNAIKVKVIDRKTIISGRGSMFDALVEMYDKT